MTGATSGIGAASAEAFASEGARVVVSDLDGDGCEAVAARIRAAGGQAIGVAADVTDPGQVENLVGAAVTEHGGLDVLHCNAGRVLASHLRGDHRWRTFDKVFAVNLKGVVWCGPERAAAPA